MTRTSGDTTALDLDGDAGFVELLSLTSPYRGIGGYTVDWRGFSKGGHLQRGQITFEVK